MVYKLTCKDRDASYIGQICRQLKTRISEYFNHIRRNMSTHSVFGTLKYSHEFDSENVGVLDKERYLSKLLISEMICIKRQKNSLNLQSDI